MVVKESWYNWDTVWDMFGNNLLNCSITEPWSDNSETIFMILTRNTFKIILSHKIIQKSKDQCTFF